MRKLILPLLVVLLCSSLKSFSQNDCNGALFIDLDPLSGSKLTCLNQPVSTIINQGPLGPCAGAATGRATWFFFLSDGTCPMLSIDGPGASGANRTEVALYHNDCATLVAGQTQCFNNGSGAWSPTASLVNGDLYIIRVWTQATSGNIGICNVKTVAQEIPLDGTCTTVHLSPTFPVNIAGNISSSAACAGTVGRNVIWAKFHTSAANKCVTVNLNDLAATQAEVVLYGNGSDCNNTIRANTSVCYADGKGVWSAGPSLPANLYTPNMDYYLRVYTNVAPGPDQLISLCGTEKTQAVNDVCTSAIGFSVLPPLPANNACAHYTGTGPPAEGITNANANYVCATTFQNMVWYKFKVTTGGIRASVSISGIDCDSYNNSSTLLQMGLLRGNCGSLTPAITPALSSPYPTTNTPATPTSCLATMNVSTVTLYTSTAVTTNEVVYLAIDGFSGANCKFNLQSIANITPIPIILKYFTAWKLPGKNQIRWVTASEHNNNYFEVERSLDGTNFISIGRVSGAGDAVTDQVYDLYDNDPPSLAYYRLKQVDIDEKYSFSEVIMLKRSDDIYFNASLPNPVTNNARITISTDKAGMVAMRIIDLAGRQLLNENVACNRGSTLVNKDLSRLAAGNYFLVLTQDSKRVVKPFVKQ